MAVPPPPSTLLQGSRACKVRGATYASETIRRAPNALSHGVARSSAGPRAITRMAEVRLAHRASVQSNHETTRTCVSTVLIFHRVLISCGPMAAKKKKTAKKKQPAKPKAPQKKSPAKKAPPPKPAKKKAPAKKAPAKAPKAPAKKAPKPVKRKAPKPARQAPPPSEPPDEFEPMNSDPPPEPDIDSDSDADSDSDGSEDSDEEEEEDEDEDEDPEGSKDSHELSRMARRASMARLTKSYVQPE